MNTIGCKDQTPSPIYSCALHNHESWEIIYHLRGICTETLGQETYVRNPGTITLIPAGIVHTKSSEEGFFDLCIRAAHLRFPETPFCVADSDGSILPLMQLMVKTLISQERCYEEITDGLLDVVCLIIRKNMGSVPQHPFVDELKNTLYHNISNAQFDLTKAIQCCGFHPDHVRRRFREKTGKTPLAYLTELRINQAKMLLLDSSFVSIADVAERCGFRDSFYFSTCFKKSVGSSPLQFRLLGGKYK